MIREIFLRVLCLGIAVGDFVVLYGAGAYKDVRMGVLAASFATVMIILAFSPETAINPK